MRNIILFVLMVMALFCPSAVLAQKAVLSSPSVSPSPAAEATPIPEPSRVDITQKSEEALEPFATLLKNQQLGSVWPGNPVKYAIRRAVDSGVPANTMVLLLLLPVVAFVIAFTRNVVGIRGFGIFLPAALATAFVATGPIAGIGLFLVIVIVSTAVRMILRKLKIKLQYLPRMAIILWAAVIGVLSILFLFPLDVSIFAVLILILLSEDFTRVQLGKSVKTAISLTFETLLLALISFFFLTLTPLQSYALLNPELTLLGVGIADFLLAKYSGLRLMEMYKFRKLISSK